MLTGLGLLVGLLRGFDTADPLVLGFRAIVVFVFSLAVMYCLPLVLWAIAQVYRALTKPPKR